MPDIDAIEGLLCQRYNVQALPAGELSTALSLARGGDISFLRDALASRDLYRWEEPIFAALNIPEPEPEPEPEAVAESPEELGPVEEEEVHESPRRGRRR